MYTEFTKDQLINALKSLQTENANLLKANTDLKKEVKSLKLQCSNFESETLSRRSIRTRSNVY
jgi:cell division septum initiation protein DivIVA